MHAYVINLARSPERLAHMTAELEKARLDYEVITGVDGRDLDLDDPAVIDPALLTRSVVPGGHGRVRLERSAGLPEDPAGRTG